MSWVRSAPTGQERARRLMAALRSEGGCPWDNEQSHGSLAKYLLEECYELAHAIDEVAGTAVADPESARFAQLSLMEELGDVYLQILFHSRIAEQENRFTMDDVADTLVEKMIERHPHVFGDRSASLNSAAEVLRSWEARKAAKRTDAFGSSVPRSMPALTRCQTLSARAANLGFDWRSMGPVLDKLQEEIDEFRQALDSGDPAAAADELGDILFSVVNVARHAKIDAEGALRGANEKFSDRFERTLRLVREETAAASTGGKTVVSDEAWDRAWNRAKQELRSAEAIAGGGR